MIFLFISIFSMITTLIYGQSYYGQNGVQQSRILSDLIDPRIVKFTLPQSYSPGLANNYRYNYNGLNFQPSKRVLNSDNDLLTGDYNTIPTDTLTNALGKGVSPLFLYQMLTPAMTSSRAFRIATLGSIGYGMRNRIG